ncbi:hypothetical protein [Anaerosporobacter faecicola]|uniref:hypothetical protein n=1 Tax=Anaerosporobacter faecicola TaxID=2718714 RepID=UPI001439511F|nr:hypothetical protein [Anaerosporobacter faecicola]
MKVLQPFRMEVVPIRKLILFNFEKDPEEVYAGLELQYLVTQEEGKGYRLIAYRKDGYVDVYDEECLQIKEVGKFEVCNKGLANYRRVAFEHTCFQKTKEGICVSFRIEDYLGRPIEVLVREHGKKPSRAFDLIAPIGVSSKKPVIFPAYAMYGFDLVRKKNTELLISIDGKERKPDPFPVPIPKDGQMRHFTRYSDDCQLVEFGRTGEWSMEPRELTEHLTIQEDGVVARYEKLQGSYHLQTVEFEETQHVFRVELEPSFPDLLRMQEGTEQGTFQMKMDESMGYFAGTYTVHKQGEEVNIELIPTEGWKSKNTMFLTKCMLNKNSVFRTWSKYYVYKQTIQLDTGKSISSWENRA